MMQGLRGWPQVREIGQNMVNSSLMPAGSGDIEGGDGEMTAANGKREAGGF